MRMGPLGIALEQMLIAKIASSSAASVAPKAKLTPWCVSLFLGFVGVGFLIAAAFIWLLNVYGPVFATASTGILILFFGALIALGAWSLHEYKKSRIRSYKNDIFKTLSNSFAGELEDPIRENPKTAVILSVLAGFLLSRTVL